MAEEQAGKVIHYYGKIGVAVIRLEKNLQSGGHIHVKGKDSDFEQVVASMQINHENVEVGKKGDEVAIKLDQKTKEGDIVFTKS